MAKRTFTKYPIKASTDSTYGRFYNCSDETLLDILGNAEQKIGYLAAKMSNSDDEEYEFTSKAKLYNKVYSTFVNELWARAKDGIFLLMPLGKKNLKGCFKGI